MHLTKLNGNVAKIVVVRTLFSNYIARFYYDFFVD